MRLWTLHPKFLDSKGLVAVWREGLLAKKVLQGKTKGYINHPQLERFKKHPRPLEAINAYLLVIWEESRARGYCFDKKKISPIAGSLTKIPTTLGQLDYELNHLKNKLQIRDKKLFEKIMNLRNPQAHPLFETIAGGVEEWEKIIEQD